MKNRIILTVILLIVLLVFSACGNNASNKEVNNGGNGNKSGETVTFKLADIQPEGYPTVLGAQEFARLVEEKTEGRYKIDVFPGGQLGDEKSIIEEIQLGSMDFARVNGVPLTEFNDKIGALNLPFLFEDANEKWDVWLGDVGEEILSSFEDSNMVGLAFYDNGDRFFYSDTKPIKNLEDIKGQKLRVMESEMAIDTVEALGGSATPMSYDEVYSAIQTGVIDGGENSLPSVYTAKHYEVAEYLTIPGYQSVPEVLIGSQKVWNNLSDEDKKIFKEAAIESIDVQREAWDALVDESLEEIEKNGNEIIEINDLDAWKDAVQPVYEKYEVEYKDILDKIRH